MYEVIKLLGTCRPSLLEGHHHPCHLPHLKRKLKNLQAVVEPAILLDTSLLCLHHHPASVLIHP